MDYLLPHFSSPTGSLRIIETTDLHMQLLDYDYFAGQHDESIGLVGLADQIIALKAERGITTLLCDNGDLIQGNPLADELAARPEAIHPMIAALNELGYDAMTLGNHEFDYGLDFLSRTLSQARFPVVSANLECRNIASLTVPYTILDRTIVCDDGQQRPIKIGLTGFGPPQIADRADQRLKDCIKVDDIVDSARKVTPLIRAAGADIVIALCHSGIGATHHSPRMENAALPLSQVEGIDVLLLGHTHETFPNRDVYGAQNTDYAKGSLHKKPAVMAEFCGKSLGVIDLRLRWTKDGWIVADHKSRLISDRMSGPDESPLQKKLRAFAAKPHAETIAKMRKPIAHTEVPITSYFATIQPDLSQQLLAHAMTDAAQIALLDSPFANLPLLAAKSSYCYGGRSGSGHYIDIPKGPVTQRDAAAIFPFSDRLCVVRRNGKQIRQWLERSAAHYGQLSPGEHDQPLINPRSAGYNCDTIFGLSYQIDLTQPARFDTDGRLRNPHSERIAQITYNGANMQDDDIFLVATNSFRAKGGGGFPSIPADDVVLTSRDRLRDILVSYLKNEQTISTAIDTTWRFSPIPQTSATFASAPKARQHLTSNISHLGAGTNGFDTYQISF